MLCSFKVSHFQAILPGIIGITGIVILFVMYFKSPPLSICHIPPAQSGQIKLHGDNKLAEQQLQYKPLMLLWFWPENKQFDFNVCKKIFKPVRCQLTDDRSLYSKAEVVVMFHRTIEENMTNLPTLARPRIQRWIWFNTDPKNNTRRIPGIERLFNLTLTYRKDGDIRVQWQLSARKSTDKDFVLPPKERFLCWIVEKKELDTGSGERNRYYRELIKHIPVDIFEPASLSDDHYFQTISSCKFYLSFEKSDDKDYITETFNGPLAVGTVPIVLGPPRKNYEEFFPGTSFIHVNDFSDAKTLADFISRMVDNDETYMRYFGWRKSYVARRHLTQDKYEFARAICQACNHVGVYREYRVVPDIYKWYFI
ncbi:alpha-(1,3)-fucosyltransferase 9-like [Thalassophryne amazonica]|uniref:alpha-(1,3)-fucosyltransferase 9-like n=1 Tax=Thalassophryne amazonica TaxID=390379 RepID=UPI001470E9BD|nr:alpha-(1,3)-fucosyltransferase 9-like [Thalassophryne amazonica]